MRIEPFDGSVPKVVQVLCKFIETHGLKTAGLFGTVISFDALSAKIEAETPLDKSDSMLSAASMLDVQLNAMSSPAIPVQFFDACKLAVVQSNDKDKLRCLRRLLMVLPPGNRSLVLRLVSFIAALKSKQKHNKIDRLQINLVFAYSICHAESETECGETSSLLVQVMSKNVTAFKKLDASFFDKDNSLPATFLGSLQAACNSYADALLPSLAKTSNAAQKAGGRRNSGRNSRRSIQGWDDVFAVVKPIGKRVQNNSIKWSLAALELGKLLFEGKMSAGEKFYEKKKQEISTANEEIAAEETVMTTADGVYSGQREEGLPHGRGKLVFSSGDLYEGDFKRGEMTGRGVLQLVDGSRYEGEFLNGLCSGAGLFNYENGDSYNGEFKNDSYEGKGVYLSKTSAYDGDFERGFRHGQGSFKALEFSYVGQYLDDQMCGMGIYTFANGDEYRGEFKDSKFHGNGVFKTKSKLVEGMFEQGRFVEN